MLTLEKLQYGRAKVTLSCPHCYSTNPGLPQPEIFITSEQYYPYYSEQYYPYYLQQYYPYYLPTNPCPQRVPARHSLRCVGCGWYTEPRLVEKCPQIGGAVMSPIFQMAPNWELDECCRVMPCRRKTAGTAPGYRHVEPGFISRGGVTVLGVWWNCGCCGGLVRAGQRAGCGCTLTDCRASCNPPTPSFWFSRRSKNQLMLHKVQVSLILE